MEATRSFFPSASTPHRETKHLNFSECRKRNVGHVTRTNWSATALALWKKENTVRFLRVLGAICELSNWESMQVYNVCWCFCDLLLAFGGLQRHPVISWSHRPLNGTLVGGLQMQVPSLQLHNIGEAWPICSVLNVHRISHYCDLL